MAKASIEVLLVLKGLAQREGEMDLAVDGQRRGLSNRRSHVRNLIASVKLERL